MRFLRRSSAAAAATAMMSLLAVSPAAALASLYRDDGDDPGQFGLSVLETLGLYVGVPLLLFLLIAAFVYAPTLVEGPRYRPGWAWWHEPVWFGGPAGESMHPADAAASSGAEPGPATIDGGGTSARW